MYNEYIDYLTNNLSNVATLNFKSSEKYCSILEHVSYEHGKQYLKLVEDEFPRITFEQIKDFVSINDRFGAPTKYSFINQTGQYVSCSPTSLRYVYHSLLILEHFTHTKCESIVEVGCGYGGLCLAIQYFSKIQSINIKQYNLIDLQPVCNLIEQYLQLHNNIIQTKLLFHTANTYGETVQDTNLFFISNYCYTEIEELHNRMYTHILLPKVSHGFITWQNGGNKGAYPIENCSEIIGKKIMNIVEERPQTDAGYSIYKNYFTYF